MESIIFHEFEDPQTKETAKQYFELREQPLIFQDKPCKVITLRDVTKIRENTELQEKNKLMNLLSATLHHEQLAPIRCIIAMSQHLKKNDLNKEALFDLTVIHDTASFLLNQVQSNLDKNLLD